MVSERDGKIRPIAFAPPEREDTGVKYPEKLIAGVTVIIEVANMAAICVFTKVDTIMPNPVVATT